MSTRTLLLATVTVAALIGAVAPSHAVPATGLAGGTALFDFDTATPGISSPLRAITGLNAGESIYGIDYRPATGLLYGLGTTGSLYTISVASGQASFASLLTVGLSGSAFDISFNPTVDRLRIVSDTGQNLRVNVDTGATTVDGMLAYGAGDASAGRVPNVVAAAYTNQVAAATTTMLYDLDAAANALVTQAPPNNGTLNTVGPLQPTGLASFDIDPNSNVGYAASASSLYQINLVTGATTALGGFGTRTVSDFAIAQVAVPEPITLLLLGTGVAGILLARRRTPVTAL